MQKSSGKGSFCLFMAACIWGMAFVAQSKGMDFMRPFTFNGVRALIGSFVLLLYIAVTRKRAGHGTDEKAEGKTRGITLKAGLMCGLALTVASTLQQFGIDYTTVGKAGFITTLYIIFVPLAGIFFGRKVSPVVWFCAFLAAVGMYLLCMTESLKLGKGDILVFLCAVVFAVYIMIVDHYAPRTDGVVVSCIQFAVCGVLCGICSLIWEHPTVSQMRDGLIPLLYAGALSCGVGYTLEIVGQKSVNPTVAALIMSLESVVATVSGWIAFRVGFLKTDQTLTPRQIAGCVIVFVAVILVQLPGQFFSLHKKKKA